MKAAKDYNYIKSEDIIQLAKSYAVEQSDMLETFLCELLDISETELYELLGE